MLPSGSRITKGTGKMNKILPQPEAGKKTLIGPVAVSFSCCFWRRHYHGMTSQKSPWTTSTTTVFRATRTARRSAARSQRPCNLYKVVSWAGANYEPPRWKLWQRSRRPPSREHCLRAGPAKERPNHSEEKKLYDAPCPTQSIPREPALVFWTSRGGCERGRPVHWTVTDEKYQAPQQDPCRPHALEKRLSKENYEGSIQDSTG